MENKSNNLLNESRLDKPECKLVMIEWRKWDDCSVPDMCSVVGYSCNEQEEFIMVLPLLLFVNKQLIQGISNLRIQKEDIIRMVSDGVEINF